MALQFIKDPKYTGALPKLVCHHCGHKQAIFLSAQRSCVQCCRYFYIDAFNVTKKIDARVAFYRQEEVTV